MEDKIPTISVASVEILVAHYVRIIKWLVIALILSICLLFSTLAIPYIFPEEVVESREIEATQQGDGAYFVGGGDINYGQTNG